MYLNVTTSAPVPAPLGRGMGAYRAPRRRGFRGLGGMGALVDDQINATLQSFLAGLTYAAQAGTAATPEQFRAAVVYQPTNTCGESSTPGVDCPGGIAAYAAKIDAAVAAYTAALAQAKATAAAYFAASGGAPPASTGGGTISAFDNAVLIMQRDTTAATQLSSMTMSPDDFLTQNLRYTVSQNCNGGRCDPAALEPYVQQFYQQYKAAYAARAGSSAGQGSTGRPLGVTLQNASGGSNSRFTVGDTFRLVVTGPANSPVTGSSNHDGKIGGAISFGNTDSSGQAVITGTMTADTVGGWSEQWFVGGQNAGSVSFSVVAASAAPAPAPAATSGGAAPPPAGSTSAAPAPAPAANGSGLNLSFLTQSAATVGGISVPWWGVIALGGGLLYAFSGKHGR